MIYKEGDMNPQFQQEMNALIAQIPPRRRGRIEELTEQIEQKQVKDRRRILILQGFFSKVKFAVQDAAASLKELDRE